MLSELVHHKGAIQRRTWECMPEPDMGVQARAGHGSACQGWGIINEGSPRRSTTAENAEMLSNW